MTVVAKRAWMPHLPLFWKELRQLLPPTLALAAAKILIDSSSRHEALFIALLPIFYPMSLFKPYAIYFAASLYGVFVFSMESRSGAFAFQLPIRRGAILVAKIAASLVYLGIMTAWAQALTPRLVQEETSVVYITLAWGIAGWLALHLRQPALALLGTWAILLILILVTPKSLSPPFEKRYLSYQSDDLGQVMFGSILILVLVGLTRSFFRFEGYRLAPRFVALGSENWPNISLLALEWRQKGFILALLAILPIPPLILGQGTLWRPTLCIMFWIPFAGAVLGALFFSRQERNDINFFLHHLPLRRWRLALARCIPALLLLGILGLETWLALALEIRTSVNDLTTFQWMYFAALLYIFGFVFGTAISAWVERPLLSILLAWLAAVWVVGTLFLHTPLLQLREPIIAHAGLLATVLGIVLWSHLSQPTFGLKLRGRS